MPRRSDLQKTTHALLGELVGLLAGRAEARDWDGLVNDLRAFKTRVETEGTMGHYGCPVREMPYPRRRTGIYQLRFADSGEAVIAEVTCDRAMVDIIRAGRPVAVSWLDGTEIRHAVVTVTGTTAELR